MSHLQHVHPRAGSARSLARRLALVAALAHLTLAPACAGDVPGRDEGEALSPVEAKLRFDYAQALGQSILFYEAQRSGARQSPRVPWRRPATLDDGADVGLDLSGGWYDAGDHVKFGLPMAYAATMLAWSVVESRPVYARTGELAPMLDNLRFVADYFLNAYDRGDPATPDDDRFAFQVGDGGADHGFWGPPEAMPAWIARPTALVTRDARGTEVVAGTAAALAAIAVAVKDEDAAYAAKLVEAAEQLYRFGDAYRGSDGYDAAAKDFYRSWSGYHDELAWGATWLYLATGKGRYLDAARQALAQVQDAGTTWGHNWDNVVVGTQVLLARLVPADAGLRQRLDQHFDFWLHGIKTTAGGLAWLSAWGSLRYATTEAFLALVHARSVGDAGRAAALRAFALRQVNYVLGDNPRRSSYVVGFGDNPPRNPHHRAAHGSPSHAIGDPAVNRFVLAGALVGGPETPDDLGWQDDRANYTTAEVACDYNAGYTGALAEILALAGASYEPPVVGQPSPPPPSPPPPSTNPLPSPPPPSTTPPSPPGAPSPASGGLVVDVQRSSEWPTGYCADVIVRNAGASEVTWLARLPLAGQVREAWNARTAVEGGELVAKGLSWNARLAPGASASWGYCAVK